MAKTLYLSLMHRWFDEIAAGEKTEEYREYTDYYINRLVEAVSDKRPVDGESYTLCGDGKFRKFVPYTHVKFFRGRTGVTATFMITGIDVRGPVFVIKIGRRTDKGAPDTGVPGSVR